MSTAQLCIRSRTGCLCVASLHKHSDWSGTLLIMCSCVWQPRQEARHDNCHNPVSEAELAGYVWFLCRNTQRHSAHHVLMRMASARRSTMKQLPPQSCVRSRTGWVCGFSSETHRLERHSAHHCSRHHAKEHMKTAPNRLRAAQLRIRSRTGWLCVVSLQRHSDWSGTVLIIAAGTTPRIT